MKPLFLWKAGTLEQAERVLATVGRRIALTQQEYDRGERHYYTWSIPLPCSPDQIRVWPQSDLNALKQAREWLKEHFVEAQE